MRRQQTLRLRFAAAAGSPELPDVNVLLQQPELEAGMVYLARLFGYSSGSRIGEVTIGARIVVRAARVRRLD
jgi:hypothetical protein